MENLALVLVLDKLGYCADCRYPVTKMPVWRPGVDGWPIEDMAGRPVRNPARKCPVCNCLNVLPFPQLCAGQQ